MEILNNNFEQEQKAREEFSFLVNNLDNFIKENERLMHALKTESDTFGLDEIKKIEAEAEFSREISQLNKLKLFLMGVWGEGKRIDKDFYDDTLPKTLEIAIDKLEQYGKKLAELNVTQKGMFDESIKMALKIQEDLKNMMERSF